jgi:hypothetical protein
MSDRHDLRGRHTRHITKTRPQCFVLDQVTIDNIHADADRNNLNYSAYIRKLVRQAHEKLEEEV